MALTPAQAWHALDDGSRERLKKAGVRNGPDLAELHNRELLALDGVGRVTVAKIRALLPPPPDPEAGHLEPQPHGGALRRGNPGNKGGRSYPNELRRKLTESFAERIDFVEDVVDGKEGEIELSHRCPECKTYSKVTLKTAKMSDRLKAWELMGKYGPGSGHTFTKEEVGEIMTELARDLQLRLRDEWERRRADEFTLELVGSWKSIIRGRVA